MSLNLYDGINRISTDFDGIQTVNIGLIFEQYLKEIKYLEGIISLDILRQHGKTQKDITTAVSYSFSDVFNGYSFTPKQREYR